MRQPVGQSFVVSAPSAAHAIPFARSHARAERIGNWRDARVLHIERLEPELFAGMVIPRYEVVLQVGTTEEVS